MQRQVEDAWALPQCLDPACTTQPALLSQALCCSCHFPASTVATVANIIPSRAAVEASLTVSLFLWHPQSKALSVPFEV